MMDIVLTAEAPTDSVFLSSLECAVSIKLVTAYGQGLQASLFPVLKHVTVNMKINKQMHALLMVKGTDLQFSIVHAHVHL